MNLSAYLFLSAGFLVIGLFGLLSRRTLIGLLISVELIINATTLNLVALGRYGAGEPVQAQIIALLIIALAACETAVGLALALAIYRIFKTSEVDEISWLKE